MLAALYGMKTLQTSSTPNQFSFFILLPPLPPPLVGNMLFCNSKHRKSRGKDFQAVLEN